MDMLGLTEDESISVLRYFKWNFDKLQNQWFEKEASLRPLIGLNFDKTIPLSNNSVN
jgi:hypothetical protein